MYYCVQDDALYIRNFFDSPPLKIRFSFQCTENIFLSFSSSASALTVYNGALLLISQILTVESYEPEHKVYSELGDHDTDDTHSVWPRKASFTFTPSKNPWLLFSSWP